MAGHTRNRVVFTRFRSRDPAPHTLDSSVLHTLHTLDSSILSIPFLPFQPRTAQSFQLRPFQPPHSSNPLTAQSFQLRPFQLRTWMLELWNYRELSRSQVSLWTRSHKHTTVHGGTVRALVIHLIKTMVPLEQQRSLRRFSALLLCPTTRPTVEPLPEWQEVEQSSGGETRPVRAWHAGH